MPFEKGVSGNPAGRPTGAINKDTELKERIELVLSECFDVEAIKADLSKMSPKDRITSLTKLIPYVLPTLRSTDNNFIDDGSSLLALLSPPKDEIEP